MRLEIEQSLVVGGANVEAIGSPTTTFKSDVISEITASTPTLVVERLTSITLMSGTTEKDTVTFSSISISTLSESEKKVVITATGSFTPGSSYTADKVRIKTATGRVYFETSITPVNITAGVPVTVTWELTMTISRGTRSGWCAQAYDLLCVGSADIYRFLHTLAVALTSDRSTFPVSPSLTITDFVAVNVSAESMLSNVTLNKTYSGTTVSITASGIVKTGLTDYTLYTASLKEGRGGNHLFLWQYVNLSVQPNDVVQLNFSITL
ncbi:MAG: hypothetical protein QXT64_08075 [Desulfurococcaceae archaeon]